MEKALVIVESPTKIKTLKNYLGNRFKIAATVGHIKDLPQKEMGIDIDNGFAPKYTTIPGKQKIIKQLRQAAANVSDIYLAPDPDREGEAIAWHTAETLKKKGRRFHRVLFHELTKKGIEAAIETPQELDRHKYEAQQTRRILDRLVGYLVSPLLWRKVKGGLSAGRVQSVAVRIICQRERDIQAFKPQEYWSITAHLEGDKAPAFEAKLGKKGGRKISIPNEAAAQDILNALADVVFIIDKIAKKTTRRNPQPPFITSKLQQEAIRKLRFSAKKTMMVAQQLYEGVELGSGEPVGLITYMRTDSTRIAEDAALEAMALIGETFGPEYVPDKPRMFKNRKKVQDAHEAVRPTSVRYTPERVARHLSKDQLALYRLIWQRFVASQMNPALIDQVTFTIAAGDYTFSATGSSIRFKGFMALYRTAEEEIAAKDKAHARVLPDLSQGALLNCRKLDPKQHFTQPPPRFSEASLVKELEENGIGRPSTYAAILSTIRDKGYVDLVKRYFRPSELGFIVNDLLVDSFPEIFEVEFTAKMEEDLDRVVSADMDSQQLLNRFYQPFKTRVEEAAEGMLSVKGVGLATDLSCPSCGGRLHIKMGRNGHFLACSNYPECTFSRDYIRDEKGDVQPIEPASESVTDKECALCGKPMVVKRGRYGEFLACSGYPECSHTESLNGGANGTTIGVTCPNSNCSGEVVERVSKRGKTFYGCSRFPECDFASWDKPVAKACPICGANFLVEKTTKRDGTFLRCLSKECGYKENL